MKQGLGIVVPRENHSFGFFLHAIFRSSDMGKLTMFLRRMKVNLVKNEAKIASYEWLGESTTDGLS